MSRAQLPWVCAALKFALLLLLRHQCFHQTLALKLAAQTVNIFAGNRSQDDFRFVVTHVDLNAGTLCISELSPDRRRNYDLTFGCCCCFHLASPSPTSCPRSL